jgi:hypothetical protein
MTNSKRPKRATGKNNPMKKIILFLTAISVFLYACKETITVNPKSADKQLLTFKINNVTEESNTVDQTSRNIRIVVAAKTDRKSLTTTITLREHSFYKIPILS